jgi:hypothetical protein
MEEACLAPRPKWARELTVVDHQLTTVHTSSVVLFSVGENKAAPEKNGGLLSALR